MLSLCARSGGAGRPTSARVSPSSAIPVRSSTPILLVFRLQCLLGLARPGQGGSASRHASCRREARVPPGERGSASDVHPSGPVGQIARRLGWALGAEVPGGGRARRSLWATRAAVHGTPSGRLNPSLRPATCNHPHGGARNAATMRANQRACALCFVQSGFYRSRHPSVAIAGMARPIRGAVCNDRVFSKCAEGLCRCFRRDQHLVGGGLKTGSNWPVRHQNMGSAGARGITLCRGCTDTSGDPIYFELFCLCCVATAAIFELFCLCCVATAALFNALLRSNEWHHRTTVDAKLDYIQPHFAVDVRWSNPGVPEFIEKMNVGMVIVNRPFEIAFHAVVEGRGPNTDKYVRPIFFVLSQAYDRSKAYRSGSGTAHILVTNGPIGARLQPATDKMLIAPEATAYAL